MGQLARTGIRTAFYSGMAAIKRSKAPRIYTTVTEKSIQQIKSPFDDL